MRLTACTLLATTAILSMAAIGTVAKAEGTAAQAASAAVALPNNVLLADWSGPYDGVPPWDKVDPKLFPQAFQFAIDERRREIDAIAGNPASATFENTLEAFEKSDSPVMRPYLEIMPMLHGRPDMSRAIKKQ